VEQTSGGELLDDAAGSGEGDEGGEGGEEFEGCEEFEGGEEFGGVGEVTRDCKI
jgi:hypothetical protein